MLGKFTSSQEVFDKKPGKRQHRELRLGLSHENPFVHLKNTYVCIHPGTPKTREDLMFTQLQNTSKNSDIVYKIHETYNRELQGDIQGQLSALRNARRKRKAELPTDDQRDQIQTS